ncbi:peroxidase 2 [Brachypodium distachyon]|uniref:Peroxidase n=1 Tax=Brachypodium distachyon TaxID=15368 RepID=I1HM82_BRADI|nr:peroxidase 2 [Brachypodium distachyon]KQK07693.1 hypothetical protein BRADI_2g37047v3 [Brachypodium distachyon]|eukprot:XP_014754090.1 peroxidase 2 [Brachypodium distachyon]
MVKFSAGCVALSLCCCLWLAFLAGLPAEAARGGKKETVEETVKRVVGTAMEGSGRRLGAALVRLLFHDCWVQGCDASVLLDTVPAGSGTGEKDAKNNNGLDGFNLIDDIKAELVRLGETNVSCADILVLAARDATAILSGGTINYAIKRGRVDGVVSSASDADAILPPSTFKIKQLKDNFALKGFTTRELVALSGAHAVGVAHLQSFADRLNSSTETPIDGAYRNALRNHTEAQKTAQGTNDPIELNNIRDMDGKFQTDAGYDATGVNTAVVGVLDNSYYKANLQNRVLFRSDWELRNDTDTAANAGIALAEFGSSASKWFVAFSNAMAKLSDLRAEGPRFEIRKNCRKIN